MAELLALLQNDPALLPCQLHRLDAAADLAGQPGRAAGVACYDGGRVLLRKRPVNGEVPLQKLAADIRSELLVAACHVTGPAGFREEEVEPFRLRHWVFASAGRLVPAGGHAAMLAALPDFLRRGIVGRSDSELAFYTALADVHAQTRALDSFDLEPAVAAQALSRLLDAADDRAEAEGQPPPQASAVLTNGRMLAAVRRGRPLYYALLEGLWTCPVCGLDRDTGETDPRVRPHRRLKAVALATRVKADGVQWIDVPEGHLVTVSRDLHVRLEPV